MRRNAQVGLFGAVVLGLLALSVLKQRTNPGSALNGGACCPLTAALDARRIVASTNQIATDSEAQQVTAYYFHGTVRCETCLLIEKLAKIVVEQEFSAELAMNRLVFASVNYDLPENAHFLKDYKLPCPSLVLVRPTKGHAEEWKLLGDTWQLVQNPLTLNRYVETEVRNFLSGQAQQVITNQVELPPVPNHR